MKKLLYVVGLLGALALFAGCDSGGGGGSTFSTLGDAVVGSAGSTVGSGAGAGAATTGGAGGAAASHIPEPGSLMLMASGLVGCAAMFFRKFKK